MGKVLLEMSMSVDDYVTGPDAGPDDPWDAGVSSYTTGCSKAARRKRSGG
jgi:hypothetical protein